MKTETNGYVLKREDTGEYYCSILDSRAKAYWWDEDINEALVFEELSIAELVADLLADEGFKVGVRGYRKVVEVFDTATSGYIDADIQYETKTYIYCSECARKDEEIKKLKKKLALANSKGNYNRSRK